MPETRPEEQVRCEPDDAEGLALLAEAWRVIDKRDEALSAADAAVLAGPTLWFTHYTRGMARRDGSRQGAKQALTDAYRAQRLAPPWPPVHNLKGVCLQDLGRQQEAEAAFAEALRLDPSNAYALGNVGALEFNRGRDSAAKTAFTQALQAAPGRQVGLGPACGSAGAGPLGASGAAPRG